MRTQEIIALERLLEKYPIAFLDNSTFQPFGNRGNILLEIGSPNISLERYVETISDYSDFLRQMYGVIEEKPINILEEINQEFGKYDTKIKEQIKRVSNENSGYGKISLPKNERKKEVLRNLRGRVKDLRNLLKTKEWHSDDSRYHVLFTMISDVSRTLNLKKDHMFRRGNRRVDKSYNDITDEKLAAAIFYESLLGKNPALISRDNDFNNLLGFVPRIIGAEEFLPHNAFFRNALDPIPFTLYLSFEENWETGSELKGTFCEYYKTLKLHSIGPKKSEQLRNRIRDYWTLFNQNL